jgi:hypothetical protein
MMDAFAEICFITSTTGSGANAAMEKIIRIQSLPTGSML